MSRAACWRNTPAGAGRYIRRRSSPAAPYLALTIPALTLLGLGIRGGTTVAAVGAFLLGLAALVRVEAAPIAPLVFAAVFLADRRPAAVKRLAVCALAWLLPLLAWSARNKAKVGDFLLDSHGGRTLVLGVVHFEANEIDTKAAENEFLRTELYARTKDLPEAALDAELRRGALAWMKSHPGEFARHSARPLVNFWRPVPRTDKTYPTSAAMNPAGGVSRKALFLTSLLWEPFLFLAGGLGLWRLRRRRELWPYAAFLLGTMGLHALSVSQMRYRLPVMPLLLIGAAWTLAGLAKRRQDQ